MIVIDVGVFAHNEELSIGRTLSDLINQSIFSHDNVDIRLVVLINGSTDDTEKISKRALAESTHLNACVVPLDQPGKSRTWNKFVHSISRTEADYLICCDADIRLVSVQALEKLVGFINDRPSLHAVPSKPVKDLQSQVVLSISEKMILASSSSLDNWKNSICGQLYIARTETLRTIWLPIGLPVEDGFVRAMILTNNFSERENVERIDSDDSIYHIYESERSLIGLVRHQIRIVIGSAINSAIFSRLRRENYANRPAFICQIAKDENWLQNFLASELPILPHGWVPFHFLTKRVRPILQRNRKFKTRLLILTLFGFCFDVLVYVFAQIKMARGYGANYW